MRVMRVMRVIGVMRVMRVMRVMIAPWHLLGNDGKYSGGKS